MPRELRHPGSPQGPPHHAAFVRQVGGEAPWTVPWARAAHTLAQAGQAAVQVRVLCIHVPVRSRLRATASVPYIIFTTNATHPQQSLTGGVPRAAGLGTKAPHPARIPGPRPPSKASSCDLDVDRSMGRGRAVVSAAPQGKGLLCLLPGGWGSQEREPRRPGPQPPCSHP